MGEGKLEPNYIFDIRPLYEFVKCDGQYFKRTEDGSNIAEVKNIEIAAIFEIGRLMMEQNICYKSIF